MASRNKPAAKRRGAVAAASPPPPIVPPAAANRLKGRFLECCDCYTICPCWVQESPDEDHCSGIYVWAFDDDAVIEGASLAGRAVAVAAFHGNLNGTQSAIFVDGRLPPAVRSALLDAFGGGSALPRFEHLKKLLGTLVLREQDARIDCTRIGGEWTVGIEVAGQPLVFAKGEDLTVGDALRPVALGDSALHDEFQLQGDVRVQAVARFRLSMPVLPGDAFEYRGRAGMAGHFDYGDGRI